MSEDRRVCLLTGASGRLGTVFCRRYADRYDIVAVTRTRDLRVPTQSQTFVDPLRPNARLPANDHPVYEIHADLGDDADLRRVVEVTLARFERIDLLVNAAVHRSNPPLLTIDEDPIEFTQNYVINASAPIRLAVLIAKSFWFGRTEENERFNRNVVNVSSTCGTYPGGHLIAYGASKAALNFLSGQLATHLGPHGVRVNVLAPPTFPGYVSTQAVADEVVALDKTDGTGTVMVLGKQGAFAL
jgi:NAD(P)-dependent dehydrogenase (short-subunit alcohol dehydrogenase family)